MQLPDLFNIEMVGCLHNYQGSDLKQLDHQGGGQHGYQGTDVQHWSELKGCQKHEQHGEGHHGGVHIPKSPWKIHYFIGS